ncbi:hypothetical protein K491DRAFT_689374 [Lophiostoma macrostomum CBS 122681]|uniref:SWR1-complex protein 3 domain-containing protein n=1 Tax=Lophiostoma macrostomum CBS 122681 TaxID=1314788 RepID=A0A6A6TJY4_9PLEO|nr:hypothetical protein K491DRAFT_689374 [Lophiostoma macrostomum CBS 122681]
MSEPRRSTRARAREEAAPPPTPEPSKEKANKNPAKSLKRKRVVDLSKDSAPATPAREPSQQAPKHVLPIRVIEGHPLPTLPEAQPLNLPPSDYQDIQHSGVLGASLQRSRAAWVSGANFRLFHALFTPPKKVADRTDEDKQAMQRQKEMIKNFPQLGGTVEAQLVIEPHTFPIRLYGPREGYRPTTKKPPQYGQWPNHNQQSPYPQQHQQFNSPTPYPKPAPPQQRPNPPKAQQKPAHNASTTPAPDPVIHMLAQRAGTDPALKAVMKIVAAGEANADQLAFFQGHISELTSILQKQKEAQARIRPPPPPPPAAVAPPPTQVPQAVMQPPHQQPTPSKPSTHAPAPVPAPQQHVNHPTPPIPHNNQYNRNHNQSQQQPSTYTQIAQPPRTTYRPLVFDFTEGNGDKFYFPSYSFAEWLPNNHGIKFSFLITKMKPKLKEEAKQTNPATPGPKTASTPASTPNPTTTPALNTPNVNNPTANSTNGVQAPMQAHTPASVAATPPYVQPPRIEDFDEKKDIKDIEFYQPMTVVVLSSNFEILQSLPRAVRPPDVVEKYMDDVFDTCKRADETYLAFRLPKEGTADADLTDRRNSNAMDITPRIATPPVDIVMGGAGSIGDRKKTVGRPRKSLPV